MKRVLKAAMFGMITGLFGVVVFFSVHRLEENFGLDLLFKVRGVRTPPDNVVLVAIDRLSSDTFSLPTDLRKWPRSLHGRLTEKLKEKGAAVIVFDVVFDDPGPEEQDRIFAEAVRRAGNVALCVRIEKETVDVENGAGLLHGRMEIEKLIPPASLLEASARVTAPFPIPKIPHKVSQYWAFKHGTGIRPTLPVAAFQLYAAPVYPEFIRTMAEADPEAAGGLPDGCEVEDLFVLASRVRQRFEENGDLFPAVMAHLERRPEDDRQRLLNAMARMYGENRSRYLDFYGPPGAIQTIPYCHIIENGNWDVKGKAVFVGLSERLRPQHKDGFFTVFSSKNGLDLSGVEIAATAFANILEGRSVTPLGPWQSAGLLFAWGTALGMLCYLSGNAASLAGLFTGSALYFFFSIRAFTGSGLWAPMLVPLLFQAPLAFFGSVLVKYARADREKNHIRRALGYHVPEKVAEQIIQAADEDITSGGELVYGVFLSTDGEKYTGLSETMEPSALTGFVNRYYKEIFAPVRQRGGIVSDVVGDSMLALWTGEDDIPENRRNACRAAMDIAGTVRRFNRANAGSSLPTRIGLHAGAVHLGHIGAIDHFEYRAVGDTVNTVTRIEKLNRHLGTGILASGEVVAGLKEFPVRALGRFLLAGKKRPVTVYELAASAGGKSLKKLWAQFAEALDVFRKGDWREAEKRFARLAGETGDGPSVFYALVCKRYEEMPPEGEDADIVRVESK